MTLLLFLPNPELSPFGDWSQNTHTVYYEIKSTEYN